MEIYEKIGEILVSKNMTKRDLAKELIKRDIRSNRTGEVLSEGIIYSYLSGATSIKAELLPHICDILQIAEQELFELNKNKRLRLINKILKNITDEEKQIIKLLLNEHCEFKYPDEYNLKRISNLLIYTPTIAIEEIIIVLEKYKLIYEEIKNSCQ